MASRCQADGNRDRRRRLLEVCTAAQRLQSVRLGITEKIVHEVVDKTLRISACGDGSRRASRSVDRFRGIVVLAYICMRHLPSLVAGCGKNRYSPGCFPGYPFKVILLL